MLGGQLRDASYGMVGPLTRLALETLRADIAFITADALDETGPIDNNSLDAEVARVMSANAARTVVLADSSKIGPGGAVNRCRLGSGRSPRHQSGAPIVV